MERSRAPCIFVSYRRDDAAGHAGRLYDSLAERFGAENVFIDIDTIDLGADFHHAIEGAVASCDVVIAVIGGGWTTTADASGRRRLDDPNDFVRLELESAFARDVPVIPACVEGAAVPSALDLPPSLASLARRQGIELRHTAWHDDVGRLIRRLERVTQDQTRDAEPPPPKPLEQASREAPGRRRKLGLLAGLAIAVAAGIAAAVVVAWPEGEDLRGRLESAIPLPRSLCDESDEPEGAVTLECAAGPALSADYSQFRSVEDLNDWYAGKIVGGGVEPETGTCGESPFKGEAPYVVEGRQVGRLACFFDSQGDAQIVWTDERTSAGGEASVYDTPRRPGAERGPAGARLLFDAWSRRLQLRP